METLRLLLDPQEKKVIFLRKFPVRDIRTLSQISSTPLQLDWESVDHVSAA